MQNLKLEGHRQHQGHRSQAWQPRHSIQQSISQHMKATVMINHGSKPHRRT